MDNKIYDGAMLHGVNKQNVAPGELGEVVSLDLGLIPEGTVDKVSTLIEQINELFNEHKIHLWLSKGYRENTVE